MSAQKMSRMEWIEQNTQMIRAQWFPKHVAALEQHGPVAVLRWANPENNYYSVTYLLFGGSLFIQGDIGEAVFRWSGTIPLDFLSRCSRSYFFEKCCAAKEGSECAGWDEAVALHDVDDLAKEDREAFAALEGINIRDEGKDALENAAREAYDETGDSELASQISECGRVPDMRILGMWVGLQTACAQIQEGNR